MTFQPPYLLRNGNLQTILASLAIRRPVLNVRAKALIKAQEDLILDGGDGHKLHGHFSRHPNGNGCLAVLIHGWEGSSRSLYNLSTSSQLWQAGFSVLRIHMRDHGPSHHLNEGLFNSTLHVEVAHAIQDAYRLIQPDKLFLGGFSLGGNFALRIGLTAQEIDLPIDKIFAVCPLINPADAAEVIESSKIYHSYFMKKWRRSLKKKLEHFSHYDYWEKVSAFTSLKELSAYLIPKYTGFPDLSSYYDAYRIDDGRMKALTIPTCILVSEDDPVLPISALDSLELSPNTETLITKHGGHCGYVKDWWLKAWSDDRMVEFFSPIKNPLTFARGFV